MNAWDRRKDESAEAFEAFVLYRDLGAVRSTAKVAKRLRKAKSLIERWSSKHDWVDRAAAWDEHLDRRWQKERADEHVEMNKRHIGIAQTMQAKLLEKMQSFSEEEIRKMSAADVARWADVAVKLERIAAGAPSELSGLADLDLSKLSKDDLETYEALVEKASPV